MPSVKSIPVYESLLYKVSMRLYEFRSASDFIIIANFMGTMTDSLNTILV